MGTDHRGKKDIISDNYWARIAREEKIPLVENTKIAVFVGGPHIKGEYYYKLFTHTIKKLFESKVDLVYLPYVIDPKEIDSQSKLKTLKQELRNNPRLVGAVITRPWKEAFLDIDLSYSKAKAINYVVKNGDGQLEGFAVDGDSWLAGLNRDLGFPYDFQGKNVVILGMGGSAKELAVTLNGKGVARLTFSERDTNKIDSMRKFLTSFNPDYQYEFLNSDKSSSVLCKPLHTAIRASAIIINATGVGRGDTNGKSPLANSESIATVEIASDLISGENTQFLQDAKGRGVTHVFMGRSMFIFGMAHFIKGWVQQMCPNLIATDFDARAYSVISDYLGSQRASFLLYSVM